MITLFRTDKIHSLQDIKELLAVHIRQLPAKISLIGSSVKILRYELSCEPVDILAWLHNQKIDTKIYWSDRDGDFEIGGVGVADSIKGTGEIDHKALFAYMEDRLSADNPRLRYYGGMSFDHSHHDVDWREFGTYQFIIPRFEVFQSGDQATFAFNIALSDINKENIETVIALLEQLNFSLQTAYRKTPQLLSRADFPDRKGWESIFDDNLVILSAAKNLDPSASPQDDSLNEKATGNLEKIVLARKSVFDFDVSLRADALLRHLKGRTPNCFHFFFQPCIDTAFLGATPERLYKREGRNIQSEAIAGTRPRGKNDQEDERLENQLLGSVKESLEHKYVVDAIRGALEPCCGSINCDETFSLRKLKGSQHLLTHFEGELNGDVCDHQILEALHPTPAVAGCPTEAAMKTIKELEPFSRGWYTGPVGYVGYDTVEFAVAIRCGLINNNQLSLYAGAGIVDGSTAEDEWDEIENKISNFIAVFNE